MTKANFNGVQQVLEEYNITDYFDYEEYGNDFDVTLYDSGYIDTTAMSEVDLHRYSLEEIKDELNYNNEETEDVKNDLEDRTIILEEIEETDEMEV